MRIKQHIIQGIFISIILAFAWFFSAASKINSINNLAPSEASIWPYISFFLMFSSLFIFIGVIYLDVDNKDAWNLRFRKRKNPNIITDFADVIGWIFKLIFFLIAFCLRYLIYYPAYWISKKILPKKYATRIADKHRAFTHSFFGIIVSAIIFYIITNFVIFLILKSQYTMAYFLAGLILIFLVTLGFIVGGIIHLMQDSYSGHDHEEYALTPLSPFNLDVKFFGNYSSWDNLNTQDKVMSVLIFLVMFLSPVFSYAITTHTLYNLGYLTLLIFNLSLLAIIFLAYGIQYDVKIKTKNRTTRLTNLFIKIIVGIIVLNVLMYIFLMKF